MAYADYSRGEMIASILLANGIAPTNIVSDSPLPVTGDVALANRLLEEASTHVQTARKWQCLDRNVELTADSNGYYMVPEGTLWIDAKATEYHIEDDRYVQLGDRLYDRVEKTDVFTVGSKVYAHVRLRYKTECLPPHIRQYVVAVAAARLAQFRRDQQLFQVLSERERRAQAHAFMQESDSKDVNVLQSDHARNVAGLRSRSGDIGEDWRIYP